MSAAGVSSTQTVTIGGGTSATAGGKVVNIANGVPGASTTNTVAIGTAGTTTGTVGVTIGSVGAAAHTTAIRGGNGATAITLTPEATAGQIVIGATAGAGRSLSVLHLLHRRSTLVQALALQLSTLLQAPRGTLLLALHLQPLLVFDLPLIV